MKERGVECEGNKSFVYGYTLMEGVKQLKREIG